MCGSKCWSLTVSGVYISIARKLPCGTGAVYLVWDSTHFTEEGYLPGRRLLDTQNVVAVVDVPLLSYIDICKTSSVH